MTGAVENRRLLRAYGGILLVAWVLLVVSAWHEARQRRHPDGPPGRWPGDWLVRWRAGDRRALVHVNARTGVPASAARRRLAVRREAPRLS